jgi:hypothetical protein
MRSAQFNSRAGHKDKSVRSFSRGERHDGAISRTNCQRHIRDLIVSARKGQRRADTHENIRVSATAPATATATALEDADLLQLALFADLSALDTLDDDAIEKRPPLLRSAIDLASRLEALGGGTLAEEKLQAVKSALAEELASC